MLAVVAAVLFPFALLALLMVMARLEDRLGDETESEPVLDVAPKSD